MWTVKQINENDCDLIIIKTYCLVHNLLQPKLYHLANLNTILMLNNISFQALVVNNHYALSDLLPINWIKAYLDFNIDNKINLWF